MGKQIPLMFLKFMLTQLSILITFEEFNRIITYTHMEFNYQILGPYLIKSSKIPPSGACHQFYDPSIDFVESLGARYTHKEYMERMQDLTTHHNQWLETPIAGITLAAGLIIELIGFVSENNILILLDYLLTMLLPHFTLFINTVSWGDLCIEDSMVLNVMEFQFMGLIGYISVAVIMSMLALLFLLLICDANPNGPLFFVFGCIWCLLVLYITGIGIVNLYCSPYIVRILSYCKFGAMALITLISNDVV